MPAATPPWLARRCRRWRGGRGCYWRFGLRCLEGIRDLNQFGGLAGLMPLYTGLAIGIFFAGLGLPGLCGFIGEVFVVHSY